MLICNLFLSVLFGIHLEMIEENDTGMPSLNRLRNGDLLLRKINGFGFYHAGVYSEKRVIEFTAPENSTWFDIITSTSSNSLPGVVSMKSVKTFIANLPYCVLRPKAIPDDFFDLVDAALDYNGIYNPVTNNCVHFALRLLGLRPEPSARTFLSVLFGIHLEMIEENDTGMPSLNRMRNGDLLLRKINGFGFYHAGVYSEKRVIEFTAPENSTWFDIITSTSSNSLPGVVSMKSVKTFIANLPYCVLRPKAIPDDFFDLVEAALDYNGIYNPVTNNCVHFALRLLGLRPEPSASCSQQGDEKFAIEDLKERAAFFYTTL